MNVAARPSSRAPLASAPVSCLLRPVPVSASAALAEFKRAALLSGLRRCKLFSDPPAVDLDAVARVSVMKLVAQGDCLFHQGAPVEGFYIVQRGAIKVYRVTQAGREQVIHVYRANESLAEEALVSEAGYLAEGRAMEESQVVLVRKREFLALLKGEPDLALRVLRAMEQHLRLLVELLDDLKLKDIKTRVANWLLQHCPNPDSAQPWVLELATTKRMLAAELGTVSETLSRTLAKLRDQGFLRVDGQRITLLCPMKLAQLARGSGGAARVALGGLATRNGAPSLRPRSPLFAGRSGEFPYVLPRAAMTA
ncbi:MAG: Crp/Fnr family transcriptional regulator [Verrucomicrobia bacterium]|nr:Crp/Fnr family transcriptional regulator [Verrucomicrobiota bacterium]